MAQITGAERTTVPRDYERRTQCLVSVGEDEEVLEMAGGNGYRRIWMYSWLQTVHLKMTVTWMGATQLVKHRHKTHTKAWHGGTLL